MSRTDAVLRDAVESFVAQLQQIFQANALEKMQSVLGGDVPRGRKRGRPAEKSAAARPRKKGGKRSADELDHLVKSLLGYVRKNPGQRIEQVAKGMGTTTKELALPAKKLIAEKNLRTKGQKRATTYFAR